MTKKYNILILGYGEMGHAMAFLLSDHHNVQIWKGRSDKNNLLEYFENASTNIDIVIFCLPVNPHHDIATQIAPVLKPDCLCLSIAKGLDELGKTAAQIFSTVLKNNQAYGLLYGPMISEEICAGHDAFAQVACNNSRYNELVENLFKSTQLYLEVSTDITGISWSAILKNVYAISFGVSDELKLGDNMRGYLAVASLQELNEIVTHIGGQTGSPYHLAGLGDLITTATSEDSHHHELGRKLARQELTEITGEGIHTLKMVQKHNIFNFNNYPLFNLILNIIGKPDNVKNQFEVYLKK